jgi:hypothetical protein
MQDATFYRVHAAIEEKIRGRPAGHRCYKSSVGKVSSSAKFAMVLRWLAGGSYIDIRTEFGMSHSFLFKTIWEVCDAINATYDDDLLPVPVPTDCEPVRASKVAILAALARGYQSRSTLDPRRRRQVCRRDRRYEGCSLSCLLDCLLAKSAHSQVFPNSRPFVLRSPRSHRAAQGASREPRLFHVPVRAWKLFLFYKDRVLTGPHGPFNYPHF